MFYDNYSKKVQIVRNQVTLLYVEDEQSTQEFVKVLFKKHENVVVSFALDGIEALELYRQNEFDIVVTDMQMPRMDGFELIEKIHAQNSAQTVAMASAIESKEDFIKALNLHIYYFFPKPLNPKTFHSLIQSLVRSVEQRREAKLNETLLEQYKNAVDSSSILSKADLRGVITFVNKKFCEISGYTQEELLGKPHSILRDPDMSKEVFADLWKTIQSKKIWQGKIKNRAKDGTTYIVDATIMPILNSNEEIIEYVGMRYDITQAEYYKEVLEKNLNSKDFDLRSKIHMIEEYERAINESATFSRTDKLGNIVNVNENFCRVSGYTKEELIGQTHNILRHPDMPKEVFKELWATIKAKNIWRGVIKNLSKDGNTNYMNTTIVPIIDVNGEIIEYMSIRFEVTDMVNLHQEIESTQKEIVYKMGEIGESRSQETGNHVKRVAEYSRLLAKLSALGDEEAEVLFTASPMHDIGKVAIPDSILKKPAQLDADEWVVMQTHAAIGYEVLKGSSRAVLKAAAIVAHEHHEKWDGSGYPRGLVGEDIHIFGRITAVADVFDALGSDRCYKKAWDDEKIFKLFKEESGRHFDPKLIDLFFENLDQFLEIRDRYKDL